MATVGRPREELNQEPSASTRCAPAATTPRSGPKDLVSEGITSSVNFPTFPRFSGVLLSQFKDKELASVRACVERLPIDEPVRRSAGDLKAAHDHPAAVGRSLGSSGKSRTSARGARAVTMPEEASNLGLPLFSHDPAPDLGGVRGGRTASLHAHRIQRLGAVQTTGGRTRHAGRRSCLRPDDHALHRHDVRTGAEEVSEDQTGVLGRGRGLGACHPRTRLVPATNPHRHYSAGDNTSPAEVLRRNMWFCMMMDEEHGLQNRHTVGVEKDFFEADYPHANAEELPDPRTASSQREFLRTSWN